MGASPYHPLFPESQRLPNMALVQLFLASLVVTFMGVDGQSADYDPLYIGKFEDLTHSVGGDIFVLDDKTIYIQDFSHDGQAPDVFFWAAGDIVLLLPKEKPTIHSIERLEVWCRAFGISFGHI